MKEKKQTSDDSEKPKADTVVKIGKIKMVVQDKGKEPMVIDKSAESSVPPIQKPFTANNHEASGSKVADKYHQPRWYAFATRRRGSRRQRRRGMNTSTSTDP